MPTLTHNADGTYTYAAPPLPNSIASATPTPSPISVSSLATPPALLNPAQSPQIPPPNVSSIPTPTPPAPLTPAAPAAPSASDFTSKVDNLFNQDQGKEAATATAETAAALPYQKSLDDINAQIAMHQANAIANQEKVTQGGGDTAFQSGEGQRVGRNDAIETMRLSSIAQALQGNIVTATKQADAAVNAQFAQVEADLRTARQNIIDHYESFTPEEQKRADATLLQINDKDAFVAQQKDERSQIGQIAIQAVQNGLTDSVTLSKIQNAKSSDEALRILTNSGYSQAPYTLSTGQTRHNGAGKVIGSGGGAGSAASNYNGEFGATIDLASNAGGTTNAQRSQIKTSLQNFIAQKDYPSAYAQIVQATKTGLKGTSGTTFENQNTSLYVLDSLQKAIQAYADQGGDTNIFKGSEDQIQTKIGQLYTDPKYAALATQLDSAFQQYRLNMTGAAFGAKESSEYASVLPNKGNSLDLNLAKLSGAKAYLNSSVEGAIKGVVGQGGIYIKQYAEGAAPEAAAPSAGAADEFSKWLQANGLQ